MGNTIDGTNGTSIPKYEVEQPKSEGPPPKEKTEGRSFLDLAASAYETFTSCSGAGAMSAPTGLFATFLNEKAKGQSILDAAGYAGAKTVAELSAHLAAEKAAGLAGAFGVHIATCVDDAKELATGESFSDAALKGPLASNVLDAGAVGKAAAAAMAPKSKGP